MADVNGDEISPVGTTVTQHLAQERSRNPGLRHEIDRMQVYRDLAGQVILYRTRSRLTQAELAKRVGTSESAIARLESGQHKPSIETMRRIADALGLRLRISFEPVVARQSATA